VAELIDRGLLLESAHTNVGTVGRPSRGVELAGSQIAGIGLRVTEQHLRAYAVDLVGAVRFDRTLARENRARPADDVFGESAALVLEALDAFDAEHITPVGLTVALPGLVDMSRGILFTAPNLGWVELPVVDRLRALLGPVGFPIRAENDANLAALAELREGVGRHISDFIYIDGGYGAGVGAGIVAGGDLFRGATGFAGEFGHMGWSRRGPRCRCGGRGCLEGVAAWDTVVARIGLDHPDEAEDLSVEALVAQAKASDPTTLAALSDVATWLSLSLVSLANLLSPEAIILGGYYAEIAPWLVPRIESDLQRSLSAPWSTCRVLVSELGRDAAIRGAAGLTLHDVLDDPTTVDYHPATSGLERAAGPRVARVATLKTSEHAGVATSRARALAEERFR
jgi:predicted NBD/HSP70 family sugar kinase